MRENKLIGEFVYFALLCVKLPALNIAKISKTNNIRQTNLI